MGNIPGVPESQQNEKKKESKVAVKQSQTSVQQQKSDNTDPQKKATSSSDNDQRKVDEKKLKKKKKSKRKRRKKSKHTRGTQETREQTVEEKKPSNSSGSDPKYVEKQNKKQQQPEAVPAPDAITDPGSDVISAPGSVPEHSTPAAPSTATAANTAAAPGAEKPAEKKTNSGSPVNQPKKASVPKKAASPKNKKKDKLADDSTEFERVKVKARPARQRKNSQQTATKNLQRMMNKGEAKDEKSLQLKSFEDNEDDSANKQKKDAPASDSGCLSALVDQNMPKKAASPKNKKKDKLADDSTEFERVKVKARPARQRKNSQQTATKNLQRMMNKGEAKDEKSLQLKSFEDNEDDSANKQKKDAPASDSGCLSALGDQNTETNTKTEDVPAKTGSK
uniref:Natural killer-tumor recognition protein n=1 Tax=Panagrolaimus sp. JU765 TaxID=591449 RepID=A0AC34R185_9BILA